MIVTNLIARFVISIASLFVPGTQGVTIWPFIFIWPKSCMFNDWLVQHEKIHLDQWKRYWIIGFPFVYFYYDMKFGYKYNPLEIEARNAKP